MILRINYAIFIIHSLTVTLICCSIAHLMSSLFIISLGYLCWILLMVCFFTARKLFNCCRADAKPNISLSKLQLLATDSIMDTDR